MKFIHAFFILQILLYVFTGESYCAIGNVTSLQSTTHVLDTPSNNPIIKMSWGLPSGYTQVNGYYVLFNQNQTHTFNDLNITDTDVKFVTNLEISSNDLTGADDVEYYFHIASEDTEMNLGPTRTSGAFRIDTVGPQDASVTTSPTTGSYVISLELYALNAYEMYISNSGYGIGGTWEQFATTKQWNIPEVDGSSTIYVQFRDRALNTENASASTTYAVQNIPLHAGWNLFSFGTNTCYYVGDKPDVFIVDGVEYKKFTSMDNILESIAGNYSIIIGYDTMPKVYRPELPMFSDMTYLAPGYGYWIKVNDDANFDGDGLIYFKAEGTLLDSSTGIRLNEGWNLVGYLGNMVKYVKSKPDVVFPSGRVFESLTSINDDIFCSVVDYTTIAHGFDVKPNIYFPSNPFVTDMNYVAPGYGYWINVSQGVDLVWGDCE
ncbi:MAG: hypothetical protein HQK75_08445 [Candidatus Magnetomorum sp.]|nr:hypothetical protein [Candidatus Magnetomorum sp.]